MAPRLQSQRLRNIWSHLSAGQQRGGAQHIDAPPFQTAEDAGFVLGSPPNESAVSQYSVREEQRQQWLNDGYCVLDSLLSRAQVESWRATLDEATAARPRRMPLAGDPANQVSPMSVTPLQM